jgi:hypothetical protein
MGELIEKSNTFSSHFQPLTHLKFVSTGQRIKRGETPAQLPNAIGTVGIEHASYDAMCP